MNRYLLSILFLFIVKVSFCQSLASSTDELYFKLLSANPDTSISTFAHKYAAIVYKRNTTKITGISMEIPKTEPAFKLELHTFLFKKHPFFNAPFTQGKVEFYTKNYLINSEKDNLEDLKLWFEFDESIPAAITYQKLLDRFTPLSTKKKFSSVNETNIAEFTDAKSKVFYGHVRIVMAKDNFKAGAYKILVEIGNDLY